MPNTSISFPSSPTQGQQYTYGSTTYIYDGTSWSVDSTIVSSPLKLDSTNNRVGINNTSPTVELDVTGAIKGSTTLAITGGTTLSSTLNVTGGTTLSSTLNVTGATTLSSNLVVPNAQVIGGFGAESTGGTTDWNDATNARSGNGYTLLRGNATNGPNTTTNFYHAFSFEYSTKDGTGNLTQYAVPYYVPAHGMYVRCRYNGTWTGWSKVLLSTNADILNPSTITSVTGTTMMGGLTIDAPTSPTHYSGIDFTQNGGSIPRARIAALAGSGSGSRLVFGTSNHYADGITHTGLTITETGQVRASSSLLVGSTSTPSASVAGYGINLADSTGDVSLLCSAGASSSSNRLISLINSNGLVGGIVVSGSGATYNTTSDYRLKENVQPMAGGLEKVGALKPSTYTWKCDGSIGQGFIAHELAEVIPLAVTGDKDALCSDGSIKPQQVDLSKVVPVLTAALQELKAIVEAQASRIAALESAQ